MPPALTPHGKAMLPCHGDMVANYMMATPQPLWWLYLV